MIQSPDSADKSLLLDHARFVRALAHQLVRGVDAEDIEQDAWLATISHPPTRFGEERSWLATVTTNLASRLRRSHARRLGRESRSAVPEKTASTLDVVERSEAIRRVADAVCALRDPYRSAILLRYYESLPPREIAKRLDAPVETVRTWLRRALEQLRARLDESQPGGRAAWSFWLSPVAAGPLEPAAAISLRTVLGTLIMKTSLKVALAFALVATTIVVAFREEPAPSIGGAAAHLTVEAEPTAPQDATPEHGQRREPAVAGLTPRVEDALGDDAPSAVAVLRGRVLQDNGAPAVGAECWIYGNPRSLQAIAAYWGPIEWPTVSTKTDDLGRFRLDFDPPPPYRFTLQIAAPGFVTAIWSWPELEAGREHDLGDVRLERGGTLVGVVSDSSGAALTEDWSITARSFGDSAGALDRGGESELSRAARATESLGVRGVAGKGDFRVENVPGGDVDIYGTHGNGLFGRQVVSILPGQETRVSLIFAPARDTQVIKSIVRPIESAAPLPAHVRLIGPDGERTAEPYGFFGTYRFNAVPDEDHVVVIDDPRFAPARVEGVRPGSSSVIVHLVGNASIALRVIDGADDEPVLEYQATIRRLTREIQNAFVPDLFLLRGPDRPAPTGGIYSELVAGDYELCVHVEGRAERRIMIEDLAAGEVRPVTARFGSDATISGVVFQSDGATPAGDVLVRLYRPALEEDGPHSPFTEDTVGPRRPRSRILHDEMTTDEAGRFHFDRVPAGTFIPRAWINDDVSTVLDPLTLSDGDVVDGLRLVLPAASFLVGQIVAPAGASLEGMRLEVSLINARRLPATIDEEGRFRAGPLLEGAYVAHLLGGVVAILEGAGSFRETDGFERELGPFEIDGGRDTEVLYDLRDDFPGHLEVTVQLDGKPAANLIVVAARDGEGVATGGVTDAAGRVILPALPAGLYDIFAWPKHTKWTTTVPLRAKVIAGVSTRWSLDLSLVEGAFQCIDGESGEPLRNAGVFQIVRAPWIARTKPLTTDAEGFLRIQSPPGEIEISRSTEYLRDGAARGQILRWTSSGPAQAEVRLPPR